MVVYDWVTVSYTSTVVAAAKGCPVDHKSHALGKESMKKTQIQYASGCPMHAENHTDYIDPNNMVSEIEPSCSYRSHKRNFMMENTPTTDLLH